MLAIPAQIDDDNYEFKIAYQLIAETNHNLFITGRAGTGKSTLLRYVLETVPKNFVVVAPTGIAAMNVGGVTLHSFFGLPLRPLMRDDEDIPQFHRGHPKRKLIEEMDTLLIDEVSMVRADLIDAIDTSLRRNGLFPSQPFGGKQVIFIGDMFQLEPVMKKGSEEHAIMEEMYASSFFFDAQVFRNDDLLGIELQQVYRQKEQEFVNLLDKIRNGSMEEEDLHRLNSRCLPMEAERSSDYTITLTSRNDLAATVNKTKLERLSGKEYKFNGSIEGEFDVRRCPAEEVLVLKEDAQVMFLKNDQEKRWVNGTMAKIHALAEDKVEVILENGDIHEVIPESWENQEYTFDRQARKITQNLKGTFKQYPLSLAWAVTIHKSQGLTFDKVIIDLGKGAFAGGQTYVAMSRCKTFEGMILKSKIRPEDIFIDERVSDFSTKVNNFRQLEQRLIDGREEYNQLKEELYKLRKVRAAAAKARAEIKEQKKKIELDVEAPPVKNTVQLKVSTEIVKANKLYSLGLESIQTKLYREAVELFESAFALVQNNKDISLFPMEGAQYKTGLCYYALKEYDIAIRNFSQALLLNEAADYYFYRGSAHYQLKNYAEAVSDYTDALRLNPKMTQAYFNRGVVQSLLGKNALAQEDWHKAASLGHEKAAELLKA